MLLNGWHGSSLSRRILPSLFSDSLSTRYFLSRLTCFPTVHKQTIRLFDVQPVLGHRQTICLSVFKLQACGASTGPTGPQINYMLICSLAWWDRDLEFLADFVGIESEFRSFSSQNPSFRTSSSKAPNGELNDRRGVKTRGYPNSRPSQWEEEG